MQPEQVQSAISSYYEGVTDNIKDANKTNKLFGILDEAGIKGLEELDKNVLQQLLIILLRQVSTAQVPTAQSACDRILLYLRKIPSIYDSFNPNPDLLKQLNFARLLSGSQSEVVYDLMIFILRYYSDVDYDHYNLNSPLKDKLIKEEKKRVWLTLEHILIKQSTFLEEFRKRQVNFYNSGDHCESNGRTDGLRRRIKEVCQ